jgi:prepilin-type N-terminal cleavage/methylation domain-containing protein
MVTHLTHSRQRTARAHARGFTLVELMAVVLIVAILGALATYSVRKYILAAKTSEAVGMLTTIMSAQEQYKAETLSYLDVSGVGNLDDYSTFYPQSTPLKRSKMAWGGGTGDVAENWRRLGVKTTSPVLYIYGCAAGDASVPLASPGITIGNFPTGETGKPWFLAKAVADLDGNGEVGTWVASSISSQIFHDEKNPEE